jgi:hypothetical protein
MALRGTSSVNPLSFLFSAALISQGVLVDRIGAGKTLLLRTRCQDQPDRQGPTCWQRRRKQEHPPPLPAAGQHLQLPQVTLSSDSGQAAWAPALKLNPSLGLHPLLAEGVAHQLHLGDQVGPLQ